MKFTYNKLKVASFIMGVFGALNIASVLMNFNALTLHEGILKIGLGLGLFGIAFEPSVLFTTFSKSELVKPRPPITIVLGLISGVLVLLAAAIWIFS